MRRFWARFANQQGEPQREVQLLAVNGNNPAWQRSGAANGLSHYRDAEAQADDQLLTGAKTGPPDKALPELEREAAMPARGMQQEKLPLSDDPFWDQE